MEFRQRHRLISRSGFSLLEVVLVIGVLSILTTIAASGYLDARQRAKLTQQTQVAETVLRQALQNSQTARFGSAWSVSCAGDHLETYVADGIERRHLRRDDFSSGVRCLNTTTVRFQKLTGQPDHPASFVLLHDDQPYTTLQITGPGVIHIIPS